MHPSSYDRCREFVERYLSPDASLAIADVGSYDVNGTYRALFAHGKWRYVGFDVAAGSNVDVVVGDPERWELVAAHHEAYDVVISGQTLEHVRRPWVWIQNVARLCRPGGLVWVCAPNTWVFHEHPIDCWRIWPDGMRALFADAGLVELECGFLGPDTVGIARKPGGSALKSNGHDRKRADSGEAPERESRSPQEGPASDVCEHPNSGESSYEQGEPGGTRVLITFGHGLGDAVQLTTVLRHLRVAHPEWSIDAHTLPGKDSALAGLCRRVLTRNDERAPHYDRVLDLAWHEPDRAYGAGVPATKAEKCLREVFQLEPQPELCTYSIAVSDELRRRAAAYLESLATRRDDGRFPVVLLHYEGNTAAEAKNLSHAHAAEVCRFVLECGYLPVILDWDNRSSLPNSMPGVVCPDAGHPLWEGRGTGDAGLITALAELATLCIGVDSGPQKCFAASGTPTIAVWVGHHPIHYFGLHDNVRHLVPVDHERLIRGDRQAREECGRTFSQAYRFATYDENLADVLLGEISRALRRAPPTTSRTLVAYSFCASHRKSQGAQLAAGEHWEMLASAMQAWNPGRAFPELVSVVGPLTEPVSEFVARRAAIVASLSDGGHQLGACTAIQQAAIYARHHGFGRLVFLADVCCPFRRPPRNWRSGWTTATTSAPTGASPAS